MYIDGSQGLQTPAQDNHRRKWPQQERKPNKFYVKEKHIFKHKQANSSTSNTSHKRIGVIEKTAQIEEKSIEILYKQYCKNLTITAKLNNWIRHIIWKWKQLQSAHS